MVDQPVEFSAADSFDLLSDETRVEIVRLLGDNRTREPDTRGFVPLGDERPSRLSYSTIKDRLDIRDNGRLNYHLSQLRGPFLTEVGGGYQLTWLGYLAYRYLIAGTFETPAEWRVELDDNSCASCGTAYVARYGPSQFLRVLCPDCQDYYVGVHYPARGVTDRPIDAVVPAAERKMRREYSLLRSGVCRWCGGRVERTLDAYPESPIQLTGGTYIVTYSCQTCGNVRYQSVGGDLIGHPAVVGFYAEHGRQLDDIRTWELDWLGDDAVTVESRDPLRVTVTVALGGETLALTVDEALHDCDIDRGI